MKENKDIVEALEAAKRNGKQTAIATLVDVTGSAYRREGAKMLIDEDGHSTGVISGGCLEPDVAITAQEVIKNGKALLKEYDMDEETVWGLGLGCPGVVQLNIEPVREEQQAFHKWVHGVKHDESGVLATVLSGSDELAGSRLFVSGAGEKSGSLGDSYLDEQVSGMSREKLRQMTPESQAYKFDIKGKPISVFIDVHVPPPRLMIFGAGHDAIPVAAFARKSGFRVTVVDQREAFANEKYFPNTEIILARPEQLADKIHLDTRTFIVIMNHHLDKDRVCLSFAMDSAAPYIGLLGPRKRRNRLLKAFQDEGVTFSQKSMSRLYNPIGLDIGAEGADEIAISIVSELIAFKRGKSGGSLSKQSDPGKIYN